VHRIAEAAQSVTISAAALLLSMNHRPGWVGASALSSTPSTVQLRPIFWMLPSAFSSMVVSPPSMLPLVGWLSLRSEVLLASIIALVAVEHRHELLGDLRRAAALRDQVLAAGDLRGLAEDQRVAVLPELSKALPTVGRRRGPRSCRSRRTWC
jgi:hypothetical protein